MGLLKKKQIINPAKVDFSNLPRHIAIIMDGNGRWAQKRNFPRSAGHAAGSETFRKIATYCKEIGIKYLSVFAFSTENWKRSEEEVSAIMSLLKKYLMEALDTMEKKRIRFCFFGDREPLSQDLKDLIARTETLSEDFEGVQVNICLNYGGRDELVRAASLFAKACVEGKAKPDDLNEDLFSGYLYSAGVPDPELIIRPSGEIRTSNFLLWQSAYSEYYFTDVLWPDFTEEDMNLAIASYQSRSRRFGGVS